MVRVGSIATEMGFPRDVRFPPDQTADMAGGPFRANIGNKPCHGSPLPLYNHGLGLRLANLFDMGDLFDMAFRWIILAIIAAILAAEGYLLTSRYLYGPLNVIDWSGRVMTLEEKELLFQEVTRETMKGETDAPADMEFASIVRSTLDPLTVCGMARLRSRSGVWASWQIIDIILPGDHPLLKATFRKSVLQGMAAPTDGHRLQYLVHDDHREITPQDSFKCEPITCEQKCDRYSWMPIATIE